jgi:hypothetical protein
MSGMMQGLLALLGRRSGTNRKADAPLPFLVRERARKKVAGSNFKPGPDCGDFSRCVKPDLWRSEPIMCCRKDNRMYIAWVAQFVVSPLRYHAWLKTISTSSGSQLISI